MSLVLNNKSTQLPPTSLEKKIIKICEKQSGWVAVRRVADVLELSCDDVLKILYRIKGPKKRYRSLFFCANIYNLAEQLRPFSIFCNYMGRQFFKPCRSYEEWAIRILSHYKFENSFKKDWNKISRPKNREQLEKLNLKAVLSFYRKTLKKPEAKQQIIHISNNILPLSYKELNADKEGKYE